MKTYPLHLEELYDEGDALGLFSRGHHPEAAFVAALQAQYGYTDGSYPAGPIRQTWWRYLPPSEEYPAGYYGDATPHARGAFPVTVVDL